MNANPALVASFLIGSVCGGFMVYALVYGSSDKPKTASNDWIKLPSGWSRRINEDTDAFTTSISDREYYWWISRRGRTIIEGPTDTMSQARAEICEAEKEFCGVEP